MTEDELLQLLFKLDDRLCQLENKLLASKR